MEPAYIKEDYQEHHLSYDLFRNKFVPDDRPFFIHNAVTEEEALNVARAGIGTVIPQVVGGYKVYRLKIDKKIGDNVFRVLAVYDTATEDSYMEDGRPKPTFSFTTGGGTRHVDYGKCVFKYPSNAPDYGDAINVNIDGDTEGTDIVMPMFDFAETHFFKDKEITQAFKRKLANLTGKVNNSPFRGWSIGEVLLTGVEGSKNGMDKDDLWSLTFNFSVSPTIKNAVVAGIKVSVKYGWDLMWVKWKKRSKLNAEDKEPLPEPQGIYVNEVYKVGDFGALGIGTKP